MRLSNSNMQRTALRAAPGAGRWALEKEDLCSF